MYFDITSQSCKQFLEGFIINCSIETPPSTFPVPVTGSENFVTSEIEDFSNTKSTLHHTNTEPNLSNKPYNDSHISTAHGSSESYTIEPDSNSTMWINSSHHRLKDNMDLSNKLRPSQDILSNTNKTHLRKISPPQKRIMFFTVEDRPFFPTWAIAMLVFIGVLVILGIILYMYH